MSFLTNVHAENKRERKLSVHIFNFIIFVMSFLIIIVYATQPFFKVRAKAELTKETLAELIQFESEDINVAELLDDGVNLTLEIVVPADVTFATAAKVLNRIIYHFNFDVDVSENVTEIIDGAVDSLVEQLLPTIENIAIKAAKQIAVTKGKDALLDALTQGNAEQTAAFEQKLESAGITDEYLEEKMNTVTDALQTEGATPDSVADTVISVMDSVIADLQTKEDTDLHIDNLDTTALKQTVVDALEMFTKEDGTIDLDSAIADLFNKVLEGESNESAKANGEGKVVLLSTAQEETQEDSVEELKLNVRNKIMSLLGDDVYEKIGTALKIGSIVLVFSMFTWVYLMVKIIFKAFMKDNTVKFKVPILFGGLPGLLWLIPSVIVHYLSKHPTILAIPYNLKPQFAASGWVAIMGILVLIILCAPYSALRKSLQGKKLRNFK
mgnify:CR=1 FL=1